MNPPAFDPAFCTELDALFHWRRDVRRFRTDALPDGLLDALLDQACAAPSVGNSQPWRFVHVQSAQRRQTLVGHVEAENGRAAAAYRDDQRAHYDRLKLHGLAECPEVLAVFCEPAPDAGHGLGRQTMAETLTYSVVCAIHTLWLSLRARGIGMGWVSILDPHGMAAMLDVPEGWQFVALLCIGYPEKESGTPELIRSGWQDRLPPEQTRLIR